MMWFFCSSHAVNDRYISIDMARTIGCLNEKFRSILVQTVGRSIRRESIGKPEFPMQITPHQSDNIQILRIICSSAKWLVLFCLFLAVFFDAAFMQDWKKRRETLMVMCSSIRRRMCGSTPRYACLSVVSLATMSKRCGRLYKYRAYVRMQATHLLQASSYTCTSACCFFSLAHLFCPMLKGKFWKGRVTLLIERRSFQCTLNSETKWAVQLENRAVHVL